MQTCLCTCIRDISESAGEHSASLSLTNGRTLVLVLGVISSLTFPQMLNMVSQSEVFVPNVYLQPQIRKCLNEVCFPGAEDLMRKPAKGPHTARNCAEVITQTLGCTELFLWPFMWPFKVVRKTKSRGCAATGFLSKAFQKNLGNC